MVLGVFCFCGFYGCLWWFFMGGRWEAFVSVVFRDFFFGG